MALPDFITKYIPTAVTDTIPPFFKNTAIGGGILGVALELLLNLTLGKMVKSSDKITFPLCVGIGLFHNQYPRFDDKAQLCITALATCYILGKSYSDCQESCAHIDERSKNNSTRGGMKPSNEKWNTRWNVITYFPRDAVAASFSATLVLELGRCAVNYYNAR